MSNKFSLFTPEPYSTLDQINSLNPVPSCSKHSELNSDFDSKIDIQLNNCFNEDLLKENETSLQEVENFTNYSNNDRYDENNNCLLTNLNEYGFRFFDLNEENNINNVNTVNCLQDDNTNTYNEYFDTYTEDRNIQNECSDNSHYDKMIDIVVGNNSCDYVGITSNSQIQRNELVPNFTVPLQDSKEDTKNKNENVCSHDILLVDFEHNLKCNLIPKEDWKYKINRSLEDIEKTISITSSENENSSIEVSSRTEEQVDKGDEMNNLHVKDDSDTQSFHSSDFEFIDELEATKNPQITLNNKFEINSNVETIDKYKDLENDNVIYDYFNEPGSKVNEGNVVPTGNDFNNLFLWSSIPYPCISMENKTVQSMSGMKVCDSAGFDMKLLHLQSDLDNNNHKEEAYESAKIILSMYPNENRGTRPQRHLN